MTQENLIAFLLDDALSEDLNTISRLLALRDIANVDRSEDLIDASKAIDWSRCVLAGSILARGSDRASEEAALRIATAAVTLSDNVIVRDAGAIILEKLANRRAVSLGEEKTKSFRGLLGGLAYPDGSNQRTVT